MNKKTLIILIVIAAILIIGSGVIRNLDKPVKLDEEVNQKWSQVEVVLQRRFDLIPNLVNTVKGYAKHEKELLTEVTKLRSQWGAAKNTAQKAKAASGLEGVLSRLLIVAERYPQLQANRNFLALQSQLEGTENRIAVERKRYNDAVAVFEKFRRSIFGGIACSIRGLNRKREYFKVTTEAAKEAPDVKF